MLRESDASFDHPVGANQYRLGNLQTKRPRCSQIYAQPEFRRLHDRHIRRPRAQEDSMRVIGGVSIQRFRLWPKYNKSFRFEVSLLDVGRGNPESRREFHDLATVYI